MATSPSKFQSNEFVIKKLTGPELAQFVRRYCDGRIYLMADVPDEAMIRTVFMPLAMGALASWSEAALQQIGMIYEEIEQAAPMTIDGLPTFLSMRLLHADDWTKAVELIDAELKRRDAAMDAIADATEPETPAETEDA
jgi:hypothetical protein